MTQPTPGWRKSSHSIDNGGANCVEVGSVSGAVLVRDTTDRAGATLTFTPQTWRHFAARLTQANQA